MILLNDFKSVRIGGDLLPLDGYIVTKYDQNGKLDVRVSEYNKNSGIYVIYMADYDRYLLLDEKMLNSTFIQLFVLENYDDSLFEPIILDHSAKIYRLKI